MEDQNISIAQWHHMALEAEETGEHIPLHFCVHGISMTPLIRTDMDPVTILPRMGAVKKGDIVLFRIGGENPKYILHRVYKVQGQKVLTLGDGNTSPDPWSHLEDVIGIAVGYYRGNHWIDLEGIPMRLWGRIWMSLFPIRGHLIGWYMKIKKNKENR